MSQASVKAVSALDAFCCFDTKKKKKTQQFAVYCLRIVHGSARQTTLLAVCRYKKNKNKNFPHVPNILSVINWKWKEEVEDNDDVDERHERTMECLVCVQEDKRISLLAALISKRLNSSLNN